MLANDINNVIGSLNCLNKMKVFGIQFFVYPGSF
jgi:hypothetical protein